MLMLLRVDGGLDGLHVVGVHVDEHVLSVHVDVVASEDVQLAVGAGLCGCWSQLVAGLLLVADLWFSLTTVVESWS